MKQLIKNTTINICQQELVNKKVENCVLVYDASGDVKFVDSELTGCVWAISGRAADAFVMFNLMMKNGAIKIVDGQMVVNTGE